MCTIFGTRLESRRARWLTTVYIMCMFVCTSTVFFYGESILTRVDYQLRLIDKILYKKFLDPEIYERILFWNKLQRKYECCGLNNATDWYAETIPNSCCPPSFQHSMNSFWIMDNVCTTKNAFPRGCITVLQEYMNEQTKLFSILALVFGCLGIIGSFFGCIHGYFNVIVPVQKQNTQVVSI